MKIGIVTFFYANNYGGVLQAFALQKFLKNSSIDSEFVNYIPNAKNSILASFKKLLKKLLKKNKLEDFNQLFKEFRENNLIISEKFTANSDLKNNKYDIIISGSDQIWNSRLNKHNTSYFTLDFINNDTKKISYASCIGQPDQINDYIYSYDSINSFDYVSVRNDFSKEFLENNLATKNIFVACDPTMLIDFHDLKYELPCKKYILIYSLNMSLEELLNKVITTVKELYNLPIIVLNSKYNAVVYDDHISVSDAKPEQWIYLFKHASYVITDSFHGVIFSLKYKKNFIALHGNDWRSYRLLDIAKRYGFIDKCIHDLDNKLVLNAEIDYISTEEKMSKHISQSNLFLLNALKTK